MADGASRRSFLGVLGIAPVVACAPLTAVSSTGSAQMYGLIGRMTAIAGQGEDLAAILIEGLGAMPGNLSYIVAATRRTPTPSG